MPFVAGTNTETPGARRFSVLLPIICAALALVFAVQAHAVEKPCRAVYGKGPEQLVVATGSPGELGLLRALAEAFTQGRPLAVCWVKAGSGGSLKLLKAKKADVVMVHAPAAEKKAVKQGWAKGRTLLGSNCFYIVGPSNDPAGVKKAGSAAEAYQRIARAESGFISRGDNSGTHKRELAVWEKAGVKPGGEWYLVNKDFMLACLLKAKKDQAYFMTDSSTWVLARAKYGLEGMAVLHQGDPMLVNTYHALSRPGAPKAAMEFINFLASEKGQHIIAAYGKKKFGQPLYTPAARSKNH